MSDFEWKPSRGFSGETVPRVTVAKFGDGYVQRSTTSINIFDKVWNLQFQQNTISDINAIEAFFVARKGVTPFTWTPPGENTEVKVVCTKWSRVYDSNISASLSATFEQVYGY